MAEAIGFDRSRDPAAGRPSIATYWPVPPGGWLGSDAGPVPGPIPVPALGPVPRPAYFTGGDQPIPDRPADAGHAPSHAAPSGPGRRTYWLAGIAAGLVALLCLGGGLALATFGAHAYRRAHSLQTVAVGAPVRDGEFQFTAKAIKCGLKEIGTPDDYQTPTGQFCVVDLMVKNVGDQPAVFADSIQRAYGANGSWFVADSAAGFYANPDPLVFMNEINPGNQVNIAVVYDIPASARIVRLELHEHPGTKGGIVKIK